MNNQFEKFEKEFEEIKEIRKSQESLQWLIMGVVAGLLFCLFLIAVTGSLIAYRQGNPIDYWEWVDGFAQNFGTEMFGALLTYLLLDRFAGRRQQEIDARISLQVEALRRHIRDLDR